MESCFVLHTIEKQVAIAYSVRDLNNKERVLYDSDWTTSTVTRIGNFRVEVDSNGREGILSAGAQCCMKRDEYYEYVKHRDYIAIKGSSVVLLKK